MSKKIINYVFWSFNFLFIIYLLLPIKCPYVNKSGYNENKILIKYTGSTCMDLMPIKGLEKYSVNCFETNGKKLNISLEAITVSNFILVGKITNNSNNKIRYEIHDWYPEKYLPNIFYSKYWSFILIFSIIYFPTLLILFMIKLYSSQKN